MPTSQTKKSIDESALLLVRDKTSNNVELVVSPANFQIGLIKDPADLTLTGRMSISEKEYVISDANKWSTSVDDHITVGLIKTSYAQTSIPSSGYVSVILPINPRVGQSIFIKDFSGTSFKLPIRVYSYDSSQIDGENYQSIVTNYGSLQFIWQGKNWSTINKPSISFLSAGANVTITSGSDGKVVISSTASGGGAGAGDVVGPASSTDNAIVRFNLSTGKSIQNSGVTIDDSNNITTSGDLAVNGGDVTSTSTTFNLLNSTVTTLNLGGAATSVNVGAVTADVVVGKAEIGAWPAGTSYAFFGNSDYDHSVAGNYALIQASSAGTKNTWLNAPTGGKVYISNNDSALGYLDDNEISLTGKASTAQTVTLGSTYGASSLTLQAGTAGVSISSTSTTTADATIGNVEIGQWPANTAYGMFGHSSLDHSAGGNYALLQDSSGATYLNAASGQRIYLRNNNSTVGYLDDNEISLTGKSNTIQSVTLGSTYSSSALTLQAGTGGINIDHAGSATISIGTTNQTRTTNIATGAAYQTVAVGSNYGGSTLLLQGGYASSSGKVSVETSDGDIEIGKNSSASGRNIYIGTGNNSSEQYVTVGSTYGASSLQLHAGTGVINVGTYPVSRTINIGPPLGSGNQTVKIATGIGNNSITVGSTSGTSSLVLQSGTGNIDIGTSNSTRTTNIATAAAYQTVTVGSSYGGSTLLLQGGYASSSGKVSIETSDGDIEIGKNSSASGRNVYVGTGNNSSEQYLTIGSTYGASSLQLHAGTGVINFGTYPATRTINIGPPLGSGNQTVKIATGTGNNAITIGGTSGNSSLTLQAGTAGVSISSTSSTTADATIGNVEIGRWPANTAFAMLGHSSLDHSAGGNYALLQDSSGATYVNAASGQMIYLRNNNSTLGYLDDNEISLTGKSSTTQTITLGSTYNSSSLTLQAGTGDINLSSNGDVLINTSLLSSTKFIAGGYQIGRIYRTIATVSPLTYSSNVELTGRNGEKTYVTIGNTASDSSLTLNAASGSISIGTTPQARSTYIATGNAAQTVTIGSTNGASSLTLNSGTGNTVIASNGQIDFKLDDYQMGYINRGFNPILLYSYDEINLTGRNNNLVTEPTYVTIGSTNYNSSIVLNAGTGAVTVPNQPSFLVYVGSTQSNIPINSSTTIAYNTEVFDIGSHFNNSTYTFTAPVTGKYIFNVQTYLQNVDSAAAYYYIDLVTSNATYRVWVYDPTKGGGDIAYYGAGGSIVTNMDANDTAYVVIYKSGGTAQTDISSTGKGSYFSGYLLG